MKIQNWAGTTVPLDFDAIYAQLKYYLVTMPKEKFFPRMAERSMTHFVRTNLNGRSLVGVEIGVHVARNSYNIMTMLPIKHLYCIDPYTKYDQEGSAANSNTDTKFIERTAHKRMKRFGDKITWIQDYSGLAADRVPDDVDFVYIDGNHTYENVVEDIELYYPKVKNGGVIGGHDFDGSNKGVCRAAIEFADKKGFELHGGKIDWWVVKKE
jgi:hypothetical protein